MHGLQWIAIFWFLMKNFLMMCWSESPELQLMSIFYSIWWIPSLLIPDRKLLVIIRTKPPMTYTSFWRKLSLSTTVRHSGINNQSLPGPKGSINVKSKYLKSNKIRWHTVLHTHAWLVMHLCMDQSWLSESLHVGSHPSVQGHIYVYVCIYIYIYIVWMVT